MPQATSSNVHAPADSPSAQGIMVGFPPPPQARVTPENGRQPLFARWSFQNMSQLYKTMPVSRGEGGIAPLPQGPALDVEALPLGLDGANTIADFYQRSAVDALLVLHKGQLVFERYRGDMHAGTQHALFSVTKSFVGLLVEMLIHEGAIQRDARASHYIAELADSTLGSATVQQLLDMQAHAMFFGKPKVPGQVQADYIQALFSPAGYPYDVPLPAHLGNRGVYPLLCTAQPYWPHGSPFRYDNCSTDTLGWIVRRVSQRTIAQLLSERIWSRLGAQHDAAMLVDGGGTEWAAAGIVAHARDLARFAEMIRCNGFFNGQQIVPTAVLAHITQGGDKEAFAKGNPQSLPGASYHDQWWFFHDKFNSFGCRGQYAQRVWIAPKADVSVIQFSTDLSLDDLVDGLRLKVWQTIADALVQRGA